MVKLIKGHHPKDPIYRKLQQYLHKLPIGFPPTITGVELRILAYLFSPADAEITMRLSLQFQTIRNIFAQIKDNPIKLEPTPSTINELDRILDNLSKRGLIVKQKPKSDPEYANIPFVIGIFELNLNNLTLQFLKDVQSYMKQGYAIEQVNAQIPQLRTIPIEQGVAAENIIIPYDNIRYLIAHNPEPIAVANCICKKGHDIDHTDCRKTKLRETCLNFGLMGQRYIDQGIGRQISRQEAMKIVEQCEAEGLIIQSMNAAESQVVCACCGCCCGVLEIYRTMPYPADFFATNYRAIVDAANCTGCGTCVNRCQMDAIQIHNSKAAVKRGRCIGCGLCASTCPTKAITITPKPEAERPILPKDRWDLYDQIQKRKKTRWQRIQMLSRAIIKRVTNS